MEPCSNEFPHTEYFYADISTNILTIVSVIVCCVLTVVCIGIFIEELVYLQRVYHNDEIKVRKLATILGLFPMISGTSMITVLVPTSTILLDLIASCYLSVCFYTFVDIIIGYFGGKDKMLEVLADDRVHINTTPCCCCCCCILKPIKMTRKTLHYFKWCSLQVSIVRPSLLFFAAVLWTDDKYNRDLSFSSSFLYINIITIISMMVSVYGTVVIFRASRDHLKMYQLRLKYTAFHAMFVIMNIQNLVFGILAMFDIPGCFGSRGPRVRGNTINHSILVIESFLLALLARKAYRTDERDTEGPVIASEAGFVRYISMNVDVDKEHISNSNELESDDGAKNQITDKQYVYDNSGVDFGYNPNIDNGTNYRMTESDTPIDITAFDTNNSGIRM